MSLRSEYYTINNGGNAFILKIKEKDDEKGFIVKVYHNDENHYINENCLVDIYEVEEILVGKSELKCSTFISGYHGDQYDGNSILLKIRHNEYVYVGADIKTFKSKHPIISYESPVDNACCPYPYAIDEAYNYYLMIEDIIIKGYIPDSKYEEDPYSYYYDNFHKIKNDMEKF